MHPHLPHRTRPPVVETQPMPLYPHATAAATKRRRFPKIHWPSVVSAGAVLLIAVIAVGIVLNDTPAQSAADKHAVISPSTAPGVPVSRRTKPVEYSPKIGEVVPGDGTWLIGREIKRGTYRSEGGEWCFWERRRDLSGEDSGVMSKGFVKGPQVVAMGPDDVAFASQGCGQWVMIP